MIAKKHFKIFLLNSSMFSLNIYQQHLLNFGYTDISIFHNEDDCMQSLALNPDIVFIDHNINSSNGVDILKKIKRVDPDIYVIFFASLDDTEAVVDVLKHGAFDFIVKGDNDFKVLDNIIMKVYRVKLLLEKNNITSFKKIL
jgi:DNA-binding NarL/FixJ family response regulator